jgi:ferredoxin
MNENYSTRFEKQINQFSENQWFETLERLLPEIHEVDRTAVQIWFRFFPLSLYRHLQRAEDRAATLHGFAMQGDYELKTQIDTSHDFLWGHRFWADVKHAINERVKSFEATEMDLANEIRMLAKSVANGVGQDTSLLIAVTAVGLMTLVQTGSEEFGRTSGETAKAEGLLKKSPEKVIAARAADKKQGLLGFLKTVDKEFQVTWDERNPKAKFEIIYDEEIASGAARDQTQNWLEKDERCLEGVIPVECRSAACGTCWVGVIGGQEKLADVQRLERKQMKVFGYKQGDAPKPFMRLACQAQAEGSVSIVIPPWNGVFGKKIYGVERVELEPATTSAKKLRETIAEVLEVSE